MATDLDQRAHDRVQTLEKELQSTIGRKVAAATALLAPVIAVLCAWLQDKLGIHLDPSAVTGVVVSTVVGITGTGVTWLYNRGGFERTAEGVVALYLRGEDVLHPPADDPNK